MAEGCQVPPLLWTPPQLRRVGSSTCVSIFCAQVHLGCPRDHHHPGSTTYQSGKSGPTSNISCEFVSPKNILYSIRSPFSLLSLLSWPSLPTALQGLWPAWKQRPKPQCVGPAHIVPHSPDQAHRWMDEGTKVPRGWRAARGHYCSKTVIFLRKTLERGEQLTCGRMESRLCLWISF